MIEPPSFNRGKAFWTVKNAFVEEASAAAFVIGFIFFPVEISTGRPHGQDHAKPRLVGHHFSIISSAFSNGTVSIFGVIP
jgi:hypothetical protein